MKKKLKRKRSKFVKSIRKIIWTLVLLIIFGAAFLAYSFSHFLRFLPNAPGMIGLPFDTKNYLIVAQNDAELRPTGGFVSSYVLLQFRSGGLDNMELHDVYGAIDDHDFVEPPYPYGELLAHKNYTGHSFRDANVYADFQSSSEELIKFFNINKPEVEIDGVVAINFSLFEEVVGVLGNLEVDGTTYNQNNLFEQLEHKLNNVDRHNIEQIYSRKQFLQPIFYATVKKALKNPHKWRALSETVFSALGSKDVQLYFKNPDLQRKYTKKGWTGVWAEYGTQDYVPDDFLAVVESNLGGMKSNRYITRNVDYNVYFNDDLSVRANTAVRISHHGTENIPLSGDYTSFVRVYAPKGSELLEKTEDYLEYEEDDRVVFGQKIALKPGESTTLYFDYTLPNTVLRDNTYRIYIPKQSSANDLYNITTHAPRGFGISSDHFETRENVASFRGMLDSDRLMQLELLPDKLSPLVVFQKMTSQNSATIHFNEDVYILPNDGLPADPVIEIIDLDFINKQSDDIAVTEVAIDPTNQRYMNIKFEGLTQAPEERYKVRIRWIADKYSNMINPNPTEITLIQRDL